MKRRAKALPVNDVQLDSMLAGTCRQAFWGINEISEVKAALSAIESGTIRRREYDAIEKARKRTERLLWALTRIGAYLVVDDVGRVPIPKVKR